MENKEVSYTTRIGNTTFIVGIKQSETAKKPLDAAFRDLCIHEALGGFPPTGKFSLEKFPKSS